MGHAWKNNREVKENTQNIMKLLLFFGVILKANAYQGSTPCPAPDWVFHKGSNRCFYLKDLPNLSFFESQQYCDKVGYRMAIAKTKDVVDYLADNYKEQGDFWLGLTDVAQKDELTWSDGTELQSSTLWDSGYPKKDKLGDVCVYLSVTKKAIMDRSCFDRKHKTLCEISEVSDCVSNPAKCQHTCVDTGLRQSKCACDYGYQLEQGTTCNDINECEFDNGGCEQACNNTIGSYNCICHSGTPLLGGRVCKGQEEKKGLMTMELVSIIITVAFPAISIIGCIMMALWRKKRIEEVKKAKTEDENEGAGEEEQAEDQEQYEEPEHYEEEEEEFDEEHNEEPRY